MDKDISPGLYRRDDSSAVVAFVPIVSSLLLQKLDGGEGYTYRPPARATECSSSDYARVARTNARNGLPRVLLIAKRTSEMISAGYLAQGRRYSILHFILYTRGNFSPGARPRLSLRKLLFRARQHAVCINYFHRRQLRN